MTTTSPVQPLATSLDPRYLESDQAFSLSTPERVMYGRGASVAVAEALTAAQLERVFVLTDGNLRAAGVGDSLIEALESRGDPTIHERVPGEPTTSEVDEIAEVARAARPTAIIAIGGGATMDTAKCLRLLVDHGGHIRDYLDFDSDSIERSEIALVAIATTAGTGAECVGAALMVDDETREKVAVSAPAMNPDISVVDPDLTLSVPAGPTAATGCDALAQAVGPLIGPRRHPVSDALAAEAIRLIAANLARAVKSGDDVEARAAVGYGSLMSGLAMRNTEAMADQFFDEVLGPRFGIPHGTVAGIVLPYVLQFNRIEAAPQIARMAPLVVSEPAASEEERVDQVIVRLRALGDDVGLPRLADLGVTSDDLPELARLTSEHPGVELGINPGVITEGVALAILQAAFNGDDPLEMEVG